MLYDRAMVDLKKSRFIEGRLALQTLINTYPDSEYLAKAKLGVADSYYREGGTSNTTQAVSEYKDFITFFPFLDEAAYAQMQIAMAHYKMMEKADRDRTEADNAEDDFQTFLLKYPQSPLVPKAEQRLREVQEVLAESQYRVARLLLFEERFSGFGRAPGGPEPALSAFQPERQPLWMLGDVYSRAKQFSKNEDDKNHWADLAGDCYRRIVTNYPLSKLAPDAKARLTAMGMPVPPPDPNALAEMKKEQLYEKQHSQHAFVRLPMAMLKSMPEVAMAAHSGQPNLTPPDDAVSATDVLKPGAAGPSFTLAMRPSANPGAGAEATDTGTPVEAVPVASDSSSGAPGKQPGRANPRSSQRIRRRRGPGDFGSRRCGNLCPSAATDPSAPPTITLQPTAAASAPPGTTPEPAASTPEASGLTQATTGTGGTIAPVTAASEKAGKADSKTESTSKKKKGIHKVMPF